MKAVARRASGLSLLVGGLQAQNHEIVQSPAFLEAVKLAGELQADLDEFWGSLQTFMEVHEVPTVKGDWGYATIATRRTLVAGKNVKPRFLKSVINTDQVRAWQKLHNNKLPEGVTEKTSKYLTKKVSL